MDQRSATPSSATTYHSFQDMDSRMPNPSSDKTTTPSPRKPSVEIAHAAVPMKRKDSGYESYTTSPRSSLSRSRPAPPSRQRTAASATSAASSSARPRTRPSAHRSSKSYHSYNYSGPPRNMARPQSPTQSSSTFFHFPSPDPVDVDTSGRLDMAPSPGSSQQQEQSQPCLPSIPQTTHYWTSDRTRRLEYAAIDAASYGFKGWVRRHLVPDCMAAKGSRGHIHFDDDTGSVRRYRLELEDDHGDEKPLGHRRSRSWHFWGSR